LGFGATPPSRECRTSAGFATLHVSVRREVTLLFHHRRNINISGPRVSGIKPGAGDLRPAITTGRGTCGHGSAAFGEGDSNPSALKSAPPSKYPWPSPPTLWS